jgi:hypothetical protein
MPEPATAVPIASGRFVYNSFRIVTPSRESEVFKNFSSFSLMTGGGIALQARRSSRPYRH